VSKEKNKKLEKSKSVARVHKVLKKEEKVLRAKVNK
jgi:hypothetical protein